MKASAKKIIGGAVLGVALLAPTSRSWAGLKVNKGVTITSSGGILHAAGAVSAARYSSDNQQYINCLISATAGYTIVYCGAGDKTGTTLTCSTDDPSMIKAVRNMNNDASIDIATPSNGSRCSSIIISNDSLYLK